MADFADTVLLNARALQAANQQAAEFRSQHYGITNAFLTDTQYTIPALAAIKEAEKQVTEVMFKKKGTFAIKSAPSCTLTGANGDSGKQAVTWTFSGTEVFTSKKRHQNNELSQTQSLADDLLMAEQSIWDDIETAGATHLNANITTVNVNSDGKGQNTWDGVNNVMQIASADSARAYNYIFPEMKRNNYKGNFYSIHNTMWEADVAFNSAQGDANATNTAFQFRGLPSAITPYSSNEIVPAVANKHEIFIVPERTLALLTWIDPLNREGQSIGNKRWGVYESIMRPGTFFQLYIEDDCADTTATGGSTQDLVTKYEIGLWYSHNNAILSTAGESTIYKYVELV